MPALQSLLEQHPELAMHVPLQFLVPGIGPS
jgi:hypothetical protein